MNNKPFSMSVRAWIVNKMAVDLFVPEKVINAVVAHQFDSARTALHNNNSVEISGFGKFLFNKKRAANKLRGYYTIKEGFNKMLLTDISETKRKNIIRKLEDLEVDINNLKAKIGNEF
jgi:nucleoid DNA-binding protein